MVKLNLKLMIIQTVLQGLFFAVFMAVFGYFMGEKFNIKLFVFHATFFGLFMGILFPIIVEILTKRILEKNIISIEKDENLVYESGSTLKCKSFSAGGKLILTNKRIAFKPNKLNSKKVFVEILLNEITTVEPKNTLGFIHNIFIVKTKNEELKFYVGENDRDTWVTKIKNFIISSEN
jgi:GRAM domain